MATLRDRRVRVTSWEFVAVGILWLGYFQFVSAQSARPQPPIRVLNLQQVIGDPTNLGSLTFHSMRANDAGIFIWAEHGESPLAGSNAVTVYQINENGVLLRTIPLPRGARLTLSRDFGLDSAGNIYFLQTRRVEARDSDVALLVKVDPRGEIAEEHPLPDSSSAFAVGGQGRVSVVTNDAEVIAPDAPSITIVRGNPPSRDESSGAPPRWLPMLEQTPDGKLVLVDGVLGTFEVLSGPIPDEKSPIASAELQATLRHFQQDHAEERSSLSFKAALRGSCVDERGTFSFTLMGTRPSHGIVVIRVDTGGNALPSFRLESPIDTNRPLAPGRPQPEGDAALMFPYDLAVWRDNVFVLGLHGLLAVYNVR